MAQAPTPAPLHRERHAAISSLVLLLSYLMPTKTRSLVELVVSALLNIATFAIGRSSMPRRSRFGVAVLRPGTVVALLHPVEVARPREHTIDVDSEEEKSDADSDSDVCDRREVGRERKQDERE